MKIFQRDQYISGFVIKNEKAYPVIQRGYEKNIDVIKAGSIASRTYFGLGARNVQVQRSG